MTTTLNTLLALGTLTFTTGVQAQVFGCTDLFACEYDPAATVDDGNDLTVGDSVQGDCGCARVLIDPDVVATQCDYPSGTYDRCDMIKADWVGADDYRFLFTPQSGGATMVHEQGLPNTFSLLSEVDGLQAGETYDLTVDAGYDLGLS